MRQISEARKMSMIQISNTPTVTSITPRSLFVENFNLDLGAASALQLHWYLRRVALSGCSGMLSVVGFSGIHFSHWIPCFYLPCKKYLASLPPAHVIVAQAWPSGLPHLDELISLSTRQSYARFESVGQNTQHDMNTSGSDKRNPHHNLWLQSGRGHVI
jgi:hypothetical protein